MKKRISTSTITKITSSPAFADPSFIPPAPSVRELIDQIRETIRLQAEDAQRLKIAAGEPDANKLTKSFNSAVAQMNIFERTLRDVPRGFKLVPVYYSRISQEQNEIVHDEYSFYVRADFLKYVGHNHADELRALGICEHGIHRMKKGLDAADTNGELYDLSIDHIIERSGGGYFSMVKHHDPDQPDQPERFPVNHFGNLILLPEKIHRFKNALNAIQKIADVGDGKWMLMLIPDRNNMQSGFVCPPQHHDHPLAGIERKPMDISRKIGHTAYLITQIRQNLRDLTSSPLVAAIVTSFGEIARLKGFTVTDIANDNNLVVPEGQRTSLKNLFEQAVAYDHAAQKKLDHIIRPALREATNYLASAFGEVEGRVRARKDQGALQNLSKFFSSRNFAKARAQIENMPLNEARDFIDTCQKIEQGMRSLENTLAARPTPNAPRKRKR